MTPADVIGYFVLAGGLLILGIEVAVVIHAASLVGTAAAGTWRLALLLKSGLTLYAITALRMHMSHPPVWPYALTAVAVAITGVLAVLLYRSHAHYEESLRAYRSRRIVRQR